MITEWEMSVIMCCRRNLHQVEPHLDYVNGGKYSVPPEDNPTRGKSYLAAVALYDFFGGSSSGYHIVTAADNRLGNHYWVKNEYGEDLDPTAEQFKLIGVNPPYGTEKNADGTVSPRAKRTSKRINFKNHLPLLDSMRGELGEKDTGPEKDLYGRNLMIPKSAPLTDEQRAKLTKAWRYLVSEWDLRKEEFIRCYFPKGDLAIQFVRALLYGEEITRTATMAYTGERFFVPGNVHSYAELLPKVAEDDRAFRSISFQLGGDTSFRKLVDSNQPLMGHRIPADFPISLAKNLINRHCPADGRVLDPCHGWGGRMVGFLLSHASSYTGVDPATHSPKLQEMFDDLSVYLDKPKELVLINKPFEDVKYSEVPDEAYDFAFTSPPYFNLEKYSGEESSWRRYPTLKAWVEGFYEPMIWHVADSLKPGAYFALQVTPKFRMADLAKDIAAEAGLTMCGNVTDTNMKRYGLTDSGATELFEVIALFRKG